MPGVAVVDMALGVAVVTMALPGVAVVAMALSVLLW